MLISSWRLQLYDCLSFTWPSLALASNTNLDYWFKAKFYHWLFSGRIIISRSSDRVNLRAKSQILHWLSFPYQPVKYWLIPVASTVVNWEIEKLRKPIWILNDKKIKKKKRIGVETHQQYSLKHWLQKKQKKTKLISIRNKYILIRFVFQ